MVVNRRALAGTPGHGHHAATGFLSVIDKVASVTAIATIPLTAAGVLARKLQQERLGLTDLLLTRIDGGKTAIKKPAKRF
jgi:hypothetical protein